MHGVAAAVLYDLNGREADEAELILGALGGNIDQYIFCSSAGVYLKSFQMPHYESDAGDPKSRHKVSSASFPFQTSDCAVIVGWPVINVCDLLQCMPCAGQA